MIACYSEGSQCCYNEAGELVTGQPGGGSIDKMSPLINFNMHSMNDLLPYAFCCRGSAMTMCDTTYGARDFRPSRYIPLQGQPQLQYELPVPGRNMTVNNNS